MSDQHILFELDKDGGFTVVDVATGVSYYAYPSSQSATRASKAPEGVALEMINREIKVRRQLGIAADARDLARENVLRAKAGLPLSDRAPVVVKDRA